VTFFGFNMNHYKDQLKEGPAIPIIVYLSQDLVHIKDLNEDYSVDCENMEKIVRLGKSLEKIKSHFDGLIKEIKILKDDNVECIKEEDLIPNQENLEKKISDEIKLLEKKEKEISFYKYRILYQYVQKSIRVHQSSKYNFEIEPELYSYFCQLKSVNIDEVSLPSSL